MSSIFLEGEEGYEIEKKSDFHEPDYVPSSEDDGEFVQKSNKIPKTVPAAEPLGSAHHSLDEFTSAFYESDDAAAKAPKKEKEKKMEENDNPPKTDKQPVKESYSLDNLEML